MDELEKTAITNAISSNDLNLLSQLLAGKGWSSCSWALGIAIEKGNNIDQFVNFLLNQGANFNVNFKEEADLTIFGYACCRLSANVVKMMLNRGANLCLKNKFGVAPIHQILNSGDEDKVNLVLQRWIDSKKINSLGLLHHYAQSKNSEVIVEKLLKLGANVNGTDDCRQTVLYCAVNCENSQIIKILLKNGANVNAVSRYGESALKLAIRKGNMEIAKVLLDGGADVDGTVGDSITPIMVAALYGREEICKLLLDRGALQDGSLIGIANKHPKVVELLLDRGFDANYMCGFQTALCSAVRRGKQESVKLLLDYGANVNDESSNDGKCALHCALQRGDSEIVKLLLDRGADINAKFFGQTALMIAISSLPRHPRLMNNDLRNLEAIVKLLFDRGAKLQLGILHAAVEKDISNIVKLLLEYGARVNGTAPGYGKSPLHLAIEQDSRDIVRILLGHGAQVNDAMGGEGYYPLHHAAENNYKEIVQLLLNHGANINAEYHGQTALTLAVVRQQEESMDILARHIILMQSLGFEISQVNLNAMNFNESLAKLQDRCALEIGLLESQTFDNSTLSYMDMLKIKDNCALAALANNQNILKIVESNDFIQEYPIYGDIIVDCINKAILKKKDFELIKKFIKYLSTRDHDQLPQLPFTVAHQIFSYFVDKDIATLREL